MSTTHRPTTRALGIAVAALGLLALASGCSDVAVRGTLSGRQLHVSGTGLGWIDATEFVPDSGGGTPVLSDRATDLTVLHLMFTEAVFDPRVDMRTLAAGEREAISSDIARGDRLFVDVTRGNVIRTGDDIELVKRDGSLPPEVLPFITKVGIVLGDPVISGNERYPDHAPRVGGDVTARLQVTETSPELVGALVVTAKKATGETDGFLEGTVTVDFGFELLGERLAECNFAPSDAGIVSACDLGGGFGGGGVPGPGRIP